MRRTLPLILIVALAACGKGKEPEPSGAPAPASTPTPAPATPAPPFPGEWRASLEGASIPDLPASGQVRGEPFKLEVAELENGILHLKQGKGFFADREFVVFLFEKEKGKIPENRSWSVKSDEAYDKPHIHVGYKTAGENLPKHDMFMNKYSMKLELGKESGKFIPGKIWLCVVADKEKGESDAAERRSWVAGTFTAKVKGFILRNGQADRTEDALDLLPWLAEEQLAKDNAGKKVQVMESTSGTMSTNAGTGSGSLDIEWSLDGAKKGWLKARFVKAKGEWSLAKLWPGEQVPEAHPEKIPDPKKEAADSVRYLAAVELEKLYAGKVVHVTSLFPNVKDGVAAACQAWCQAEGEEQAKERTLFFTWKDGAWVFDRILAEGERFNARTGTVEKP